LRNGLDGRIAAGRTLVNGFATPHG
jgi:hypothetical protein